MRPRDRRRLLALVSLLTPLAGSAAEVMESRPDRSPPLWLMPTPPAQPRLDRRPGTIPMPKDRAPPGGGASPQGLAPSFAPPAPAAAMPAPLLGFDGIGQGFPLPGGGSYAVKYAPPDPVGAAGPLHYLAAVNADLAVFGRGGAVLLGPVALDTLWSGFAGGGGLCAGTNGGDPVVLYDSLADRWFASQLGFGQSGGTPVPPFYQCIAVSATGDPTGSWNRYAFGPFAVGTKAAFNDYPKFGLWPDGYYASYNMFDLTTTPETLLGVKACALERSAMIAGTAARQACQDLPPLGSAGGAYSLLPAHLDGPRPPPPGSPGLFASWDFMAGVIRVWTLAVTWGATPAVAVSSRTVAIPALTGACPAIQGCSCVAQPGTATLLDSMCDRLMFRLAYRNLGGRESLLAVHTVAQGPGQDPTAVRWYELRNAAGQTLASAAPVLFQSGATPSDSTFRWMPSAAMDQMGNLAVGYSTSSAQAFPGLRWAGQLWSDPAGALAQGETAIFAGSGSQTTYQSPTPCGTCRTPPCTCPLDRWGDYSAMVVDPADDCTFWYVNEYLPATGSYDWRTRVGAFAFPTCPPRYAVAGPAAVPAGAAVSLVLAAEDALGAPFADYAGTAVLSSSDPRAVLPAGPVAFAGGVAVASVTFQTQGTQTLTARDPLHPAVAGSYAVTVRVAGHSGGCGCGAGGPEAGSLLALAALIARRRPRLRARPAAAPPPRRPPAPAAAAAAGSWPRGAAARSSGPRWAG